MTVFASRYMPDDEYCSICGCELSNSDRDDCRDGFYIIEITESQDTDSHNQVNLLFPSPANEVKTTIRLSVNQCTSDWTPAVIQDVYTYEIGGPDLDIDFVHYNGDC